MLLFCVVCFVNHPYHYLFVSSLLSILMSIINLHLFQMCFINYDFSIFFT